MRILETRDMASHLQFLPDSRRLLVAVGDPQGSMGLEVWTLLGGERVRLPIPKLDATDWYHMKYGAWTAIHPSGDWCYVTWNGHLFSFHTADGRPRPVPKNVKAHQVIVSPSGHWVTTAYADANEKELSTFPSVKTGGKVSRRTMSPEFRFVAGFLPEGERLVWIEGGVRIGTADKDDDAPPRTRRCLGNRPQISPDGRYLAVLGYSSMYLYDLPALGKPRQIKSSSNFGDFRSLAFHPDGRTMAMIHGGPTLVKVYDLATLRLKDKYQWKVGQLDCVAYSPDGLLGAAGSRAGKVVVWDVEG